MATITTSGPSTRSSTAFSTGSISDRYGLNDKNRRRVLVYMHPDDLITSSQQDLCKLLETEPNLRLSKVPIPYGNSRVDIHQRDLIPEMERKDVPDMPSMNLSLANVNLGRAGHLKRLLGLQRELYVVSRRGSPHSSPESSQIVEPPGGSRALHHKDDTPHALSHADAGADANISPTSVSSAGGDFGCADGAGAADRRHQPQPEYGAIADGAASDRRQF